MKPLLHLQCRRNSFPDFLTSEHLVNEPPQTYSRQVYAADGMPQMICNMCRWNLDRSYKFKLQCKKADEALRDYPLSGVLPRPFPPIPNDPPIEIGSKRPAETRSQHDSAKKPRSDNDNQRDTRERRETRERERERERERQSEKKEKSSEQHHDLYEEEQDGGSEGEQEEEGTNSTKEERKLEPGEIRVHACDQCERTFPLRQALALHILRAHRDRNYKCTECERHFFTKYDLGKHMSTHSEEKPFSCSVCQKQFSRLNLLQRHEKVHRDEARYACQHCEREFFTTEELEKHEDTMHKKDKPFQCNICNKRFQYKQGLERHEMLHSEDKTFVCDYCKEAFHTSTKLARHLSTHAGHRPFMCKLCPRTFLLSHHLTRHMRTHSVEKRHVCEDCGKAFKRKESLEVHQLTHTKRTGMGLTCDVCQESCRNRADYVTHIKQHIEAGEKMGPDGLQPDSKNKSLDLDSDEEEEEEDQYSDGDDDYTPPAYIAKKLPKPPRPSESEEEEEEEEREDKEEKSERQEKEDRKEHQVVYVRGKDGNMVKKTIKTLMPIQRRDIQEQKTVKPSAPTGSVPQSSLKSSSSSQIKDDTVKSGRVDETEAQVQKIVASVFKEHKIPLKHQNAGQDQSKDSSAPMTRSQTASQETRKDNDKTETVASTPKAVNTVKVIKRIVLRKPAGGSSNEGTPVSTSGIKDGDASITGTPGSHKVKRVIVRRIIRQGDTTREVIMNPDGTAIDPAELAKLPTGNVVKRVVVKRPFDKSQSLVQAVLQSAEQRQKAADTGILNEKFELKTSTSPSGGAASTPKSANASQKTQVISQGQDQETKEKLEQLEKRVEQQRLKIEELQARKAQQDYEAIDEMLPERHDESEDEQQLPLKRVFVKRKQSIYDEEREYNDDVETETTKINPTQEVKNDVTEQESVKEEEKSTVEETLENVQKEIQSTTKTTTTITTSCSLSSSSTTTTNSTPVTKKGPTISSNKVYSNKRYMIVKPGETSEVEEMSRELCSILETTDNVVKMQETVLSNLTQISGIAASSTSDINTSNVSAKLKTANSPMEVEDEQIDQDCVMQVDCNVDNIKQEEAAMEVEVAQETEIKLDPEAEEPAQVSITQEENQPDGATLSLDTQDLSETASIFESSDDVLEVRKSTNDNLSNSVIELSQGNDTINLNDTNDSQDSLEDKLSQMEG
ncbi:zinc finger protein 26 [Lasius niger]|uniref:Zinc finger protein 26 n=1 Tax=Lasius niger TaxID=67767 RepID=A0A0J7KEV4_LASNI|nr:zinc finger protein 26 [Lasius niger]